MTSINPPLIAVPGSIDADSFRNEEQAIEWARNLADTVQASYDGTNTLVTVIFENPKTQQTGQVLSEKHAEIVNNAFGRPNDKREWLRKYLTEADVMQMIENNLDQAIDYDRLANAVSQNIIDQLPQHDGITIEQVEEVVARNLQPVADNVVLSVDHARAANMQTKEAEI